MATPRSPSRAASRWPGSASDGVDTAHPTIDGRMPLYCDGLRVFPVLAMAHADTESEPIARNRRARHDYHILETWEAGLVLTGTEVKALRNGRATISDAYAVVNSGEVFLLNLHIGQYDQGHQFNHEPTRTRKLLLHKKEIRKMIGAVERQGLTLIPLDMYFKRGRAKVLIGLARGKQLHDKRESERKRDDERAMARALRTR
jgi:SsrA-binding protein